MCTYNFVKLVIRENCVAATSYLVSALLCVYDMTAEDHSDDEDSDTDDEADSEVEEDGDSDDNAGDEEKSDALSKILIESNILGDMENALKENAIENPPIIKLE